MTTASLPPTPLSGTTQTQYTRSTGYTQSKLIRCLIVFAIGVANGLGQAKAAESISVGVIDSENFPYATMMKNSFEMALEVINNEGGIKGRPLKLVYANEGKELPVQAYQHWLAESAIKGLVKKHEAVMLVGGYASSTTIHTARLAEKFNVPFF